MLASPLTWPSASPSCCGPDCPDTCQTWGSLTSAALDTRMVSFPGGQASVCGHHPTCRRAHPRSRPKPSTSVRNHHILGDTSPDDLCPRSTPLGGNTHELPPIEGLATTRRCRGGEFDLPVRSGGDSFGSGCPVPGGGVVHVSPGVLVGGLRRRHLRFRWTSELRIDGWPASQQAGR